jgi:hypothetical protein
MVKIDKSYLEYLKENLTKNEAKLISIKDEYGSDSEKYAIASDYLAYQKHNIEKIEKYGVRGGDNSIQLMQ